MSYIEVKHSSKNYKMGDTVIKANYDVNFEIEKGNLPSFLVHQVLGNLPC